MSRSLKNASEKKDLFFATLAHDLKNPVEAQILSLKMLANGSFGKLNSKQGEMLNILLESSNYMHNMLQSVLNSYKFDNGNIFLAKQEFYVSELLENCINEVNALAISKKIKIILNIQNSDIKLYADATQLRRVIENLLNNSLTYSFKNSDLKISVSNDNKKIIFNFENNSPVIPSDIKKHLFEKYITGMQTGTGLGLYFSKKIIEAHEGRIYFEGNGTSNKFIFEIPLKNLKQTSIDL